VKVEDGHTGIAYNTGDVEGLISALKRGLKLYEDKEGLRTIQRSAVITIKEKYTWHVVKKQYLELYIKAKKVREDERRTSP
jgi:starch synthase